MFGQTYRKPWRHMTLLVNSGGTIRNTKITKVGDKVYTDQLVSMQPGMIPTKRVTLPEQEYGEQ